MEALIEQLGGILAALGLPGVIIAVLMYRDNKHTERNNELVDKLIELGNKGVEQNAAMVASINNLQQTVMLSRNAG